MKVLVTELVWPQGIEAPETSAEVEYDPDLWRDPDKIREKLSSADALIVRNQTNVDAALLEAGDGLRAVGRLGVGLGNVDLAAAWARGVPVVAARNANAVSVAEYVMAAILQVCRDLAGAADVRAGGRDRRRFAGTEVHGKVLGLVGMGRSRAASPAGPLPWACASPATALSSPPTATRWRRSGRNSCL